MGFSVGFDHLRMAALNKEWEIQPASFFSIRNLRVDLFDSRWTADGLGDKKKWLFFVCCHWLMFQEGRLEIADTVTHVKRRHQEFPEFGRKAVTTRIRVSDWERENCPFSYKVLTLRRALSRCLLVSVDTTSLRSRRPECFLFVLNSRPGKPASQAQTTQWNKGRREKREKKENRRKVNKSSNDNRHFSRGALPPRHPLLFHLFFIISFCFQTSPSLQRGPASGPLEKEAGWTYTEPFVCRRNLIFIYKKRTTRRKTSQQPANSFRLAGSCELDWQIIAKWKTKMSGKEMEVMKVVWSARSACERWWRRVLQEFYSRPSSNERTTSYARITRETKD